MKENSFGKKKLSRCTNREPFSYWLSSFHWGRIDMREKLTFNVIHIGQMALLRSNQIFLKSAWFFSSSQSLSTTHPESGNWVKNTHWPNNPDMGLGLIYLRSFCRSRIQVSDSGGKSSLRNTCEISSTFLTTVV